MIRDIPAPVSLHNINGKMMWEIVLMYGRCEDRSNSIWTGSGHISNLGAEDLQITSRAVCAGSFRLFILDIALVGCLTHGKKGIFIERLELFTSATLVGCLTDIRSPLRKSTHQRYCHRYICQFSLLRSCYQLWLCECHT